MLRIIACIILIFLFGILYAEILNSFDLPKVKLNVYIFGVAISFVYFISEVTLKYFEKRSTLSNQHQIKFDKIRNIYFITLSIIGLILLVMVPFVWWGAIKKLAESANKGGY